MTTELQNTNNNWVYQSNKLIEASYTLTVVEQKLIRLLASMIKKDDDDFKSYEFKTKDLIKLLNTSDSRFYRDIDNITDLLMQRIIKIKDMNTREFEKYHWVDVCKYKGGILKLKINKELKPFYLSLDWYTKYQLKNIMQFKSTYSFRIYELLKQYENISNRSISINDLRIILDVDKKKYLKYANLKQKVINVAQKEINLNSDISFDFEEIKTGRKVTTIKFIIRNGKTNADDEIAVTEDEIQGEDKEIIKQVKAIFIENITSLEAYKILKSANGDIGLVKAKYEIAKTQGNIKNIVAWLISAIENDYNPSKGKGRFNSFRDYSGQREVDIEELEKEFLGRE